MKNTCPLLCWTVSLILLLNSCEYQLSDNYYSKVVPNDSVNIVVYLDPSDSVYILTGTTVFNYQALTKGITLANVSVFVDNQLIGYYLTPNGTFNLDCLLYSDGEHELSIVVTTNAGSGSMADLLGAEGYISADSWKFIVNNSPPNPVKITNIYNDNGLLKVEWEKYTGINFTRYEVFKWNSGDGLSQSLGVIDDRDVTFLYDPAFIGGTSQYYIRVTSPRGLVTNGEKKTFTDNLPVLSARWIKDNQVELSWDTCKYSKAFESYRVLTNENQDWKEIHNVNSTRITGDYGIFGGNVKFSLEVLSKYINSISVLRSSTELAIGRPFPDFGRMYKNNVNNDILLTGYNKIYRYRLSTGQYLDSLSYSPQNPGFIYSPADDVLLQIEPFLRIDPVKFETTSQFNNVYFNSLNLSLSSQGIAWIPGGIALYDYKNMKVLKPLNLISNSSLSISADSKYIFDRSPDYTLKCYNIEGEDITHTWDNSSIDYLLIPGSPDKIMIITPSFTIEIRDIATNQLIKSFPVSSIEMLDIDPVNKIVMLRTGNGNDYILELYNYETGQKVKTLKATNFRFSIINGTIYSNRGTITVF